MGYPMTWQRVLHRNGLTTGDYDDAGEWATRVNVTEDIDARTDLSDEQKREVTRAVLKVCRERIVEYEGKMKYVLGDLRRLEHDTLDERAVCATVAHRTGVDREIVAAVLAEFLRW